MSPVLRTAVCGGGGSIVADGSIRGGSEAGSHPSSNFGFTGESNFGAPVVAAVPMPDPTFGHNFLKCQDGCYLAAVMAGVIAVNHMEDEEGGRMAFPRWFRRR